MIFCLPALLLRSVNKKIVLMFELNIYHWTKKNIVVVILFATFGETIETLLTLSTRIKTLSLIIVFAGEMMVEIELLWISFIF